ncbi:dipicolinate synthase subunit B [uncultured Ruminococcus sp.]|uniref:dipicolinate synthase subunit B n=1 Tax=uncultured Ruminococcus sp. TaxID=165186 RepID=UPI000EE37F1F|nr:dipicolinate synthase subunit B [uncultured Ruminococcus sp.]HCJ41865.1 dipicolinate synthase subunit B [Ruminococcus sp.]
MLTKNTLAGVRIGYGLSGSFCTFEKSFAAAERLRDMGAELLPIMSFNAASIDTRFGKAADHIKRLEKITGRSVITTIEAAEPIGPKKLCDVMAVAPCTANTAAKLAMGITDTPLTMAVKSHLRCGRPVVIAISTNDALSACAKNLGLLQNCRNYYFVPYSQDDCINKPASAVADFSLIEQTIAAALDGLQLQPVLR